VAQEADDRNADRLDAVSRTAVLHDIWHQRALADAANVLGQTEKSAYHMALYDKKLEKAKSRRDTDTPKGPMRTPTIPYSDMGRLRWPGC